MFSPASPVSAALSDGAKPEPHTLNNALIPPARCARLKTHFCQDSASGYSEQKLFVPGGCWGGKFLDVPVQWTIYLVEKVFQWSFPPGIYGLGLLFLGFFQFFSGIIVHPSDWQNALWVMKLREVITKPLLCCLLLLNSMKTSLKRG